MTNEKKFSPEEIDAFLDEWAADMDNDPTEYDDNGEPFIEVKAERIGNPELPPGK